MGSYGLAAVAPGAGLWIRDRSLGTIHLGGGSTRVSLSMAMLAGLLLNAGLGVDLGRLGAVLRRPKPLGVGLLANLFIPILYILGVTKLMAGWHNADEVQSILVGLALVGSMPIAGSSTAWAQNADGDVALSLGMVLFSTLLSPITTPIALHAAGLMASGEYSERLHSLAAGGTGTFLGVCVLGPSLVGILIRKGFGGERVDAARPRLKLANSAILLVLNYANASLSLPKALADPDLDFLLATLAIVCGLCAIAFASGWGTSRWLGADRASQASLMFGLGMNNNGTGLVLASLALADYPRVMLPIIFYNLVQHLAAGLVDRGLRRPSLDVAADGVLATARPETARLHARRALEVR